MSCFDRILFAADFSDRSREAFRVACSLADEAESRLFVLHVVEPMSSLEQAMSLDGGSVGLPLTKGADVEALGARLRASYLPDRPFGVEYLVREGVATETIVRAAGEVNADLIVLGTQGRTGLDRLLLGSVAEAVLRRAPCPVLALRATSAPGEGRPRVIIHPTDLSDFSEPALRVARALARQHGARLVLVHVIPVGFAWETVMLPEVTPGVQVALERLRSRTDGPDLKDPVHVRLMRGDVASAILRASDEEGGGMIVLGTHGRASLGRLLMGSVAEAVLRRAPCPVLAVKPEAPSPTSTAPPAGPPTAVGA